MSKNDSFEERFMQLLNKSQDTCASCKHFDNSQYNCEKRNIEVGRITPKCEKWEYVLGDVSI